VYIQASLHADELPGNVIADDRDDYDSWW
jgi:predicted deacylase